MASSAVSAWYLESSNPRDGIPHPAALQSNNVPFLKNHESDVQVSTCWCTARTNMRQAMQYSVKGKGVINSPSTLYQPMDALECLIRSLPVFGGRYLQVTSAHKIFPRRQSRDIADALVFTALVLAHVHTEKTQASMAHTRYRLRRLRRRLQAVAGAVRAGTGTPPYAAAAAGSATC